mgnify:CR=1 FL=1
MGEGNDLEKTGIFMRSTDIWGVVGGGGGGPLPPVLWWVTTIMRLHDRTNLYQLNS